MKNQVAAVLVALSLSQVVACGSDKKTTCVAPTASDFANSSYAPAACSSQMFAKYGDAGFQAVNKAIITRALAAPTDQLGSSFQTKLANASAARQTEFTAHLLQFLETAYGSATPYNGPTMTASHADLDITFAQYNYFVTDVVVPALKEVITDPSNQTDIGNCFAPVLSNPEVIKTVVTCK